MLRLALIILLLGLSTEALAQEADFEYNLDGYYRVRPTWIKDAEQPKGEVVDRFIHHRFRIEPHLYINEYISVHAQADALDGIWGSNPGNVLTQSTADRTPNIVLRRASGEVTTPVGVFRVGRMGSHWGRGILSNDGDGFRNDFGDAFEGDTYDRILFITKPLGVDGPLTTALLYDKILETDNVFLPGRGGSAPGLDPILQARGDADQYGVIVHYRHGPFGIGTYTLLRRQHETKTQAWIPDLYATWRGERLTVSLEAVGIFGRTEAVTALFLPGQEFEIDGRTRQAAGFLLANPKLDIEMVGASSEVGFQIVDAVQVALEAGYASGDEAGTDTFSDGKLSTFSFDPDYNVGLIMWDYANRVRTQAEFEAVRRRFNTPVGGQTLAELCTTGQCTNQTNLTTAEALNDFIEGTSGVFVPSNGAVRNAFYLFPKVRLQPLEDLNMILAAVWARAIEPIPTLAGGESKDYGLEFDLGVHYDYTRNFRVGLEAGWFLPGEIFDTPTGESASSIFHIQPRFTVVF